MTEQITYIKNRLKEYGISCSTENAEQLFCFYQLVVQKNKMMNLTTITEFEEFVDKHIADSLIIEKYIALDHVKSMIDVGSGGGFPGLPIKIAYPNIVLCSLDSVKKKIEFQEQAAKTLHFHAFTAIHMRAEDAAHDFQYREGYEVCVSRAVAEFRILCEYCLPFVKKGGLFVAYKSGTSEEEIKAGEKALQSLGGKIIGIENFELNQNKRSLVIVEKIRTTPIKFPRKAGIPTKQPL